MSFQTPLTSWSVFNPWARRVSVRGQRGVAVGVCVGEAVVVGFRVSHVRKGLALLRFRVGEDPVQRPLQVIVLNSKVFINRNTLFVPGLGNSQQIKSRFYICFLVRI